MQITVKLIWIILFFFNKKLTWTWNEKVLSTHSTLLKSNVSFIGINGYITLCTIFIHAIHHLKKIRADHVIKMISFTHSHELWHVHHPNLACIFIIMHFIIIILGFHSITNLNINPSILSSVFLHTHPLVNCLMASYP